MTAVSNKKIFGKAVIFALLLSLALTFGHAVYNTNSLAESWSGVAHILRAVLTAVVLFAGLLAVTFLLFKLASDSDKLSEKGKLCRFLSSKKGFLILWALVFLCYLPCFLAYYPGFMSYDIIGQDVQASTHVIDNHHPPIHTFIWGACIYLESILGLERVTIYELIQMLAVSYAASRMINFMAKRNAPAWLLAVSFVFIAVNPLCALASLIPAKDIFCAVFLILLSISTVELISSLDEFLHSAWKCMRFILEAVLFCLFRNNAIYAVLISTVVFWAVFKGNRTRIAVIFLASIIGYYLVTGSLYDVLGVKKLSSVEMYSIPLQQIGYTVTRHEDEIPEDIIEEIDKFLPCGIDGIKKAYNPRFADPMKGILDMSYGVKPLAVTWMKLLVKYPVDFISAFLTHTVQWWYLPAESVDQISGRLFIETVSTEEELLVQRHSYFPGLLAYYSKAADCSGAYRYLPLSIITSIAVTIWLMIFCALASSVKVKRAACLFAIPILFWMTYLLAPVCNFRFVFPLYAACPLFAFAGLYPQSCFDSIKQKTPK